MKHGGQAVEIAQRGSAIELTRPPRPGATAVALAIVTTVALVSVRAFPLRIPGVVAIALVFLILAVVIAWVGLRAERVLFDERRPGIVITRTLPWAESEIEAPWSSVSTKTHDAKLTILAGEDALLTLARADKLADQLSALIERTKSGD